MSKDIHIRVKKGNTNMENKYQQFKIYKITDACYNKIYYGSTTQPLCRRMSKHRECYQRYKSGQRADFMTVYSIFDEYGIANCKIELVEQFPCDGKEDLLRREGWYIQNHCCVNKVVPKRTHKEYVEQHKERRTEYMKQYSSAYYETHKDEIKDKTNEYYKKNKDTINARLTEAITCSICNCCIRKNGKPRHERTLNHLQNLGKSSSLEQSNN